jgi:precorrin-6Y C5,15-methyltransferase (decarboxylating)
MWESTIKQATKPAVARATQNNTIHVVGLGVAQNAQLSIDAQRALQNADIVFGSKRQLATIATFKFSETTEQRLLPPLSELKSQLKNELKTAKHYTIIMLASGDPLYYGIGRWVNNHFSDSALYFHPAVSSIQAACHQLGLSLQDVEVISLHGRPLVSIRRVLKAQKTLLILTDKNSQPYDIAKECIAAGFEKTTLWVCERLGYPQQKVREFSADTLVHGKWLTDTSASAMPIADTVSVDKNFPKQGLLSSPWKQPFDPLHVTVVNVQGKGNVLPEFPGIPDERFSTGESGGKGMISKREVRLAILSFLQTENEDVLWDVGAGCGGVAVELAYWHPRATIYAVECHEQRLQYLFINRDRFGVINNLHIIQGRAPEVLHDLPAPNKVFIGGSDGELTHLLPYVWSLLPATGVLVVSAVTDNTRRIVDDFMSISLDAEQREHNAESVDVTITRKKMIDGQWNQQKKLPVTLYRFKKD